LRNRVGTGRSFHSRVAESIHLSETAVTSGMGRLQPLATDPKSDRFSTHRSRLRPGLAEGVVAQDPSLIAVRARSSKHAAGSGRAQILTSVARPGASTGGRASGAEPPPPCIVLSNYCGSSATANPSR
jgi:hypothetical protein